MPPTTSGVFVSCAIDDRVCPCTSRLYINSKALADPQPPIQLPLLSTTLLNALLRASDSDLLSPTLIPLALPVTSLAEQLKDTLFIDLALMHEGVFLQNAMRGPDALQVLSSRVCTLPPCEFAAQASPPSLTTTNVPHSPRHTSSGSPVKFRGESPLSRPSSHALVLNQASATAVPSLAPRISHHNGIIVDDTHDGADSDPCVPLLVYRRSRPVLHAADTPACDPPQAPIAVLKDSGKANSHVLYFPDSEMRPIPLRTPTGSTVSVISFFSPFTPRDASMATPPLSHTSPATASLTALAQPQPTPFLTLLDPRGLPMPVDVALLRTHGLRVHAMTGFAPDTRLCDCTLTPAPAPSLDSDAADSRDGAPLPACTCECAVECGFAFVGERALEQMVRVLADASASTTTTATHRSLPDIDWQLGACPIYPWGSLDRPAPSPSFLGESAFPADEKVDTQCASTSFPPPATLNALPETVLECASAPSQGEDAPARHLYGFFLDVYAEEDVCDEVQELKAGDMPAIVLDQDATKSAVITAVPPSTAAMPGADTVANACMPQLSPVSQLSLEALDAALGDHAELDSLLALFRADRVAAVHALVERLQADLTRFARAEDAWESLCRIRVLFFVVLLLSLQDLTAFFPSDTNEERFSAKSLSITTLFPVSSLTTASEKTRPPAKPCFSASFVQSLARILAASSHSVAQDSSSAQAVSSTTLTATCALDSVTPNTVDVTAPDASATLRCSSTDIETTALASPASPISASSCAGSPWWEDYRAYAREALHTLYAQPALLWLLMHAQQTHGKAETLPHGRGGGGLTIFTDGSLSGDDVHGPDRDPSNMYLSYRSRKRQGIKLRRAPEPDPAEVVEVVPQEEEETGMVVVDGIRRSSRIKPSTDAIKPVRRRSRRTEAASQPVDTLSEGERRPRPKRAKTATSATQDVVAVGIIAAGKDVDASAPTPAEGAEVVPAVEDGMLDADAAPRSASAAEAVAYAEAAASVDHASGAQAVSVKNATSTTRRRSSAATRVHSVVEPTSTTAVDVSLAEAAATVVRHGTKDSRAASYSHDIKNVPDLPSVRSGDVPDSSSETPTLATEPSGDTPLRKLLHAYGPQIASLCGHGTTSDPLRPQLDSEAVRRIQQLLRERERLEAKSRLLETSRAIGRRDKPACASSGSSSEDSTDGSSSDSDDASPVDSTSSGYAASAQADRRAREDRERLCTSPPRSFAKHTAAPPVEPQRVGAGTREAVSSARRHHSGVDTTSEEEVIQRPRRVVVRAHERDTQSLYARTDSDHASRVDTLAAEPPLRELQPPKKRRLVVIKASRGGAAGQPVATDMPPSEPSVIPSTSAPQASTDSPSLAANAVYHPLPLPDAHNAEEADMYFFSFPPPLLSSPPPLISSEPSSPYSPLHLAGRSSAQSASVSALALAPLSVASLSPPPLSPPPLSPASHSSLPPAHAVAVRSSHTQRADSGQGDDDDEVDDVELSLFSPASSPSAAAPGLARATASARVDTTVDSGDESDVVVTAVLPSHSSGLDALAHPRNLSALPTDTAPVVSAPPSARLLEPLLQTGRASTSSGSDSSSSDDDSGDDSEDSDSDSDSSGSGSGSGSGSDSDSSGSSDNSDASDNDEGEDDARDTPSTIAANAVMSQVVPPRSRSSVAHATVQPPRIRVDPGASPLETPTAAAQRVEDMGNLSDAVKVDTSVAEQLPVVYEISDSEDERPLLPPPPPPPRPPHLIPLLAPDNTHKFSRWGSHAAQPSPSSPPSDTPDVQTAPLVPAVAPAPSPHADPKLTFPPATMVKYYDLPIPIPKALCGRDISSLDRDMWAHKFFTRSLTHPVRVRANQSCIIIFLDPQYNVTASRKYDYATVLADYGINYTLVDSPVANPRWASPPDSSATNASSWKKMSALAKQRASDPPSVSVKPGFGAPAQPSRHRPTQSAKVFHKRGDSTTNADAVPRPPRLYAVADAADGVDTGAEDTSAGEPDVSMPPRPTAKVRQTQPHASTVPSHERRANERKRVPDPSKRPLNRAAPDIGSSREERPRAYSQDTASEDVHEPPHKKRRQEVYPRERRDDRRATDERSRFGDYSSSRYCTSDRTSDRNKDRHNDRNYDRNNDRNTDRSDRYSDKYADRSSASERQRHSGYDTDTNKRSNQRPTHRPDHRSDQHQRSVNRNHHRSEQSDAREDTGSTHHHRSNSESQRQSRDRYPNDNDSLQPPDHRRRPDASRNVERRPRAETDRNSDTRYHQTASADHPADRSDQSARADMAQRHDPRLSVENSQQRERVDAANRGGSRGGDNRAPRDRSHVRMSRDDVARANKGNQHTHNNHERSSTYAKQSGGYVQSNRERTYVPVERDAEGHTNAERDGRHRGDRDSPSRSATPSDMDNP